MLDLNLEKIAKNISSSCVCLTFQKVLTIFEYRSVFVQFNELKFTRSYLNRDWHKFRQPEVKAVTKFLTKEMKRKN